MRNHNRFPLLLVTFFSLFCSQSYSQTYTGSVSLYSQAQVDAFPATYGNATVVVGYIRIRSSGTTAITNLDSLAGLQYIDGTLDIRDNTELVDLDGLSNLDSIGDNLFMSNNEKLTNINGFKNLNSIGRNLEMARMDLLENLDGFSQLKAIYNDIYISFLPAIQELDSLHNLQYVAGSINLTWLSSLTNIDGLGNLSFIGGNLLLADLAYLPNVDAFSTLTSLEGTVYMLRNPFLANVDGLSNLLSVGGLYLAQNATLSECCGVFYLVNTPGVVAGYMTIFDNQSACDSPEEVLACDGDGDGILEPEDCDDGDATVYPGAPELCDGLDNNCDGELPEDEVDDDNDGVYLCEDCNDNDNTIYTGAPELCDGLDNNCDGAIDENVICYCDSYAGSTDYEWIQKVELEGIDNDSGNDNGYSDYTSLSADLASGSYYPIKLTPGYSGFPRWEFWSVWIDFNADGDFEDEDELVYNAIFFSKVYGFIHIPATANIGTTTMRVAMKRDGFADDCGEFSEGEVEDYTVNISYCDNIADGGIIEGDELLCEGNSEATIINDLESPTGGSGIIEYQWFQNTNSDTPPTYYNMNGWTLIPDANDAFYLPDALNQTTWFLRYSRRQGCTTYVGESNVVEKRVQLSCDPYCESSGISSENEWIKTVKLEDINNTSGNDGGYGNYTNLSTMVLPDKYYKITLKPDYADNDYKVYWKVWIDWNQDGDFEDDGELEVKYRKKGKFSKNIKAPDDALPGSTRMRVAMKKDYYPGLCELISEGEVEDYTIEVISVEGLVMPGNDPAIIQREDEEVSLSVSNVMLYPNPTVDRLQVYLSEISDEGATLEIYNGIGQRVESRPIDKAAASGIEFDVSEYGEGVYILSINEIGKDRILKQFLVVH